MYQELYASSLALVGAVGTVCNKAVSVVLAVCKAVGVGVLVGAVCNKAVGVGAVGAVGSCEAQEALGGVGAVGGAVNCKN